MFLLMALDYTYMQVQSRAAQVNEMRDRTQIDSKSIGTVRR